MIADKKIKLSEKVLKVFRLLSNKNRLRIADGMVISHDKHNVAIKCLKCGETIIIQGDFTKEYITNDIER